ncbi:hypothetical protein ACFPM3_11425 [Streptomyces coeruleoprunus]|uniref:MaoC-like domain-containing protein n=1 Tax=Streptomyces coeruleoprunus TaxID=285563 RepID=A0ABV9XBR1_9ACTN
MPLPVTPHGELAEGRLLSWRRRYSPDEIAGYDALSGRVRLPEGSAPTLPDLLVVAPLTKLGGDLDYIARKMTWSHARAVGVDEELTAELEILQLEENTGFHRIAFDARVRGNDGDVVLSGRSKGIILHVADPAARPDVPEDAAAPALDLGAVRKAARPEADGAPFDGPAAGAVLTATTTVTSDDIDLCTALTGDRGAHHLGIGGDRPMAQGLLTATTVPFVRGDRGFRYRSMSMVFLQPVHAGDVVTSEVTVTDADPAGELSLKASVRNQDGTEVFVSECTGVLPDAAG